MISLETWVKAYFDTFLLISSINIYISLAWLSFTSLKSFVISPNYFKFTSKYFAKLAVSEILYVLFENKFSLIFAIFYDFVFPI